MSAPTLFHNIHLIDPQAETDSRGWLLVDQGRILDRGDDATPSVEGAARVDGGGACLAPGVIDMRVWVGEPGGRHKESLRSAGEAAAAGGVCFLATQPDTAPPIDSPEAVEFVRRRASEACAVQVRPMAGLTRSLEGREMTEHQFLLDAGAAALTDGDRPMADAGVFLRCLRYAASLGALVCHDPQEPGLSALGCATSGKFATLKGLPDVPAAAESIMLARDMRLVALSGVRYHAALLSTAESLGPLRRGREAGLPVSAGVSAAHLALNEFDIADFRTFCKVTPPLRAEEDRAAMVEALASGEIDVLVSDHRPQDEDSKRLPFAQAASGAVGVETLLVIGLEMVHGGHLSLPILFQRLSATPARLLGLEGGRLAKGAPADLVLFDPDIPWIIDRKALRSKAKNSAFDRRRVQGRVLGTWIGGRRVYGEA